MICKYISIATSSLVRALAGYKSFTLCAHTIVKLQQLSKLYLCLFHSHMLRLCVEVDHPYVCG
jgi:hypothetical protein